MSPEKPTASKSQEHKKLNRKEELKILGEIRSVLFEMSQTTYRLNHQLEELRASADNHEIKQIHEQALSHLKSASWSLDQIHLVEKLSAPEVRRN
mgnify:CR=1 FL=1